MATGQTIADEVRTQLNDGDSGNRRWADAELLGYINAAIRQIVLELPEANAVETLVTLTANETRQSIPTGGVKFLGAWNYDAVNEVRGPAITSVELDALNSFQSEWSYPGHLDANLNWPSYQEEHSQFMVEHTAHDPREPKTFYVFPPPPAGSSSEAVLLEQSGVTDTALHNASQSTSHTVVLPAGTDNRTLIVYVQINTGTVGTPDMDDLVLTYGGVTMNKLTQTFTNENLDGVDLGQAVFALSVSGQTFSDEELVVDGTGWNGLYGVNVFAIDFMTQVWDNLDPAYADFSFSSDSLMESAANTIDVQLSDALTGDLVVSFIMAGKFGTSGSASPIAGNLEITDPASGYTYDEDDITATSFTDSFMVSRVAYSTTIESTPVDIEWTHGDQSLWDPAFEYGHISFVMPQIAGGAAGTQIYVRYSFIPTALAALANTFPLGDEYINAAVDYVTFRALMKDGRNAMTGAQRTQLWNNFLMALGKKPVTEERVDTRQGRAGGDGNG